MLLQRLVDYAATLEKPLPMGYGMASVRYEIHLDGDGHLEMPEPIDLATKENKFGQRRPVPQVRRSGTKPPPILLADHAEYTLGLARKPEDTSKAAGRQQEYLQLLAQCVEATGNPVVASVYEFLAHDPVAQLHIPADFEPSGNIEFRVNGRLATEEADVRRFWGKRNQPDGDLMQCIVCNEQKPALDTLSGVIKGIPGGNATGTALITANEDAFLSYGLTQSKISPICLECADQFMKGLNALIANRSHSLRIQDTVYLFWTKEDVGFSIAGWFDAPDPNQVRELINSVRTGKHDPSVDAVPFYALALTANNARAVVRDWVDTTLGQVKASLGIWFAQQAIVGPYGEDPAPLGIYALAASTVRDPKKELTSLTVTTLLRSALAGTPPPDRLLQQVVRRCQVEQEVTRPRAALMKLVLSSQSPTQEDTMIELQPDHPESAYHCGRLLAVLEIIQRRSADGQLNTTLVDRFYGTASSAPASVFGTLIRGAQPHISKLRKNKPGLAVRLEQEMEDVLGALSTFPPILTAKQQALFALGYYHQRAFSRAQAQTAQLRRANANAAPDTDGTDTLSDEEAFQ
ncbi:MAG: type I-C CRISPR-associated protein Cas8c/Csd1 [Anaerolinea sp.]|nr:type I-C CRISPR-associated protein Cas8c/Csd1 [Anaerolinea sp.]